MTPARRRKLIKIAVIFAIAFSAGVLGRFLFMGDSLPSLLLGRKPGSAAPGTVLVKAAPVNATGETPSIEQADSPTSPEAAQENSKPVKVDFDLLGGWQFVEGKTPIPPKVRELDGKWVELTGYMLPINETQNITRFVVIQSLWGCCFGQTPDVNHVIVVNMEPGKVVDFYPDPVKIVGRFNVGETREEGFLVSIYQLEANRVVVR
jgi:hypothetical protein